MADLGILNENGFNALTNNSFSISFNLSTLSNYIYSNNFSIVSETVVGDKNLPYGFKLYNIKFGSNPKYFDNVFYQYGDNQYNYNVPCFILNYQSNIYLCNGVKRLHNLYDTGLDVSGNMFINNANSSFDLLIPSKVEQRFNANGGNYTSLETPQVYYFSPFNGRNFTHQQVADICFSYNSDDYEVVENSSYHFRLNRFDGFNSYIFQGIDMFDLYPGAEEHSYMDSETTGANVYTDFMFDEYKSMANYNGGDVLIFNYDYFEGSVPSNDFRSFNYSLLDAMDLEGISKFTYNNMYAYNSLFLYDSYGRLVKNNTTNETESVFYYTPNITRGKGYLTNYYNYRNIDAKTNNTVMYQQKQDLANQFKNYVDNPLISTWYWGDNGVSSSVEFYGFLLNSENLSNYFLDSSYLNTLIMTDYYKVAFNSAMDLNVAGISSGIVLGSIIVLSLLMYFLKRII